MDGYAAIKRDALRSAGKHASSVRLGWVARVQQQRREGVLSMVMEQLARV